MNKNPTNTDKQSQPSPRPYRFWRRLARVLIFGGLGLVVLFIALVLFVKSEKGQRYIVTKATTYLSEKTETDISIDKLFITFSGKLDLEGFYIEDLKGDTLVYSKSLKLAVPFIPILKGKPISLNRMEWEGLRAKIYRNDTIEGFNFQFLADAFASDDTEEKMQEEASDLPDINVGKVMFSDFKLEYKDSVSGMFADLNLGRLYFKGDEIDLNKMIYSAKDFELENTYADFKMTKLIPEDEDDTPSVLPFISVHNFKLKNVEAHYESSPGAMAVNADIKDFLASKSIVDLPENRLQFGTVALNHSYADFKTWGEKDIEIVENKDVEEDFEFSWPNWDIAVDDLTLDQTHFIYQGTKEPQKTTSFNPDYIDVEDLSLSLKNTELSKAETLKTSLEKLNFKEGTGIELNNLTFDLDLNPSKAMLSELRLETGNSFLRGKIEAGYESIAGIIKKPNKTTLNIDLPQINVDLNEVYAYLPDLKNNPYLKNSTRHKVNSQLKATGSLAAMNISNFRVGWGANTNLTARGYVNNLTDIDRLSYDLKAIETRTLRADILQFIDDADYGLKLPDTIQLSGAVKGDLNDYSSQSKLVTSNGKIDFKGHYNLDSSIFEADIKLDSLHLGELLNQPDMGYVSLTSDVEGSGANLNELNVKGNIDISQLQYNKYDFTALKSTIDIEEGQGDLSIDYKDDNLDFSTVSHLKLDSINQFVSSQIDIHKADLKQLKFYKKDVVSKLKMTADFENLDGDMNLKAHIDEGIARYQNWDHKLGQVDFSGSLKNRETRFAITSNFLNGDMRANANTRIMGLAFKRQLRRYFKDSIYALDSIKNPLRMKMHLKLNENDVINNVFLTEIKEMDTLRVDINFNQKEELLTSQITLPKLKYSNYELEDLFFNINSAADVAQYILGFENLDAGAFGMYRTFISGDLFKGMLTTNFFGFDKDDNIFYSGHSQTTGKEGHLRFHLIPENLVMDNKEWSIPEDNELVVYKDSISAHNFSLTNGNQKLEIANTLTKIRRPQIGISFENFELQNFLSILNPDKGLASGILQGRLVAVNPRGRLGLLGDLAIEDLNIMETPLGDLSFKALSRDTDSYKFLMDLKGDDTDIEAKGGYVVGDDDEDSSVNLELAIHKFGFKTIAQLSQNQLDNASGFLKGNLTVEGSLSDPQYDGELQFDNASFRATQINSKFSLNDEKILINNSGLLVNQFAVRDEHDHKFLLDGAIITKKWQNPEFDLKLRANDFQLMNSTAKDNDLFYGKLNFDLIGYIQGKMSLPDVFVNFDINKDTDFTYVYSESQAGIEKRDGIVEFVDKENTEPVFVKRDSTFLERMKGIQFHAKVNIDKKANFNIVLDPRTGDNVLIGGEAALDYRITANGTSNLTGRYVVDRGHYKMNLYNLVKREFQFKQGSTIVWNGEPMDADLDISAIYETKASASGLMASETGGIGVGESNQYKKRLPFLVFLNIKGTIDKPELSFGLDMPEDSKGELGGAVYGKVNQLNEDENELNRQVFSLLVLKQFFPQSGSDGSGGGFAGIATDNLTDALADQLSAFSDQLLGQTGIQLNFGLDSYTDYQGQSSQQRTDLSINAQKSLFNDRLIVKAGTDVNVQGEARPGEENPVLGNVSIEYLLTEDGRWRIRGFRNDEYDNVIDGQVFINGIGLIFQRDFNRFSYLWRSFIGDPEKYYAKKRKEREEKKRQKEERNKTTKLREKTQSEESNDKDLGK